jgi:hypothetical protein
MAKVLNIDDFDGLLVKINRLAGGSAGGKLYRITEADLKQFEVTTDNPKETDNEFRRTYHNLEYAVYRSRAQAAGSIGTPGPGRD